MKQVDISAEENIFTHTRQQKYKDFVMGCGSVSMLTMSSHKYTPYAIPIFETIPSSKFAGFFKLYVLAVCNPTTINIGEDCSWHQVVLYTCTTYVKWLLLTLDARGLLYLVCVSICPFACLSTSTCYGGLKNNVAIFA